MNPAKQGWLWLALFALGAHLAFQGARGVDNSSEGRYAECARAMVASGDFLTPTLNGLPHWTKPPLGYWSAALGIQTLGVNPWGARLGNALAGAATVLLVGGAAAAFFGNAVGLTAGWVYLSSPFPYFGAYALTVDTVLTLWAAAAVFCFARFRRAPVGLGWVIGFWVACGMGFMTKGPLIFLPLAPLLIWHVRSGGSRRIFHPAGLAAFAVSGLWWFVAIFMKHPELLRYYLEEELLARLGGKVGEETTHNRQFYKSFTIYLPVLTVGAGPWLYYAGSVFRERELWKPKVVWKTLWDKGHAGLFLSWLLLPLVLFFLSSSRLHLYVLPLYAAVAIVAAHEVVRRHGGAFPARKLARVALTTLAVLLFIKGAFTDRSEIFLHNTLNGLGQPGLAKGLPPANNMGPVFAKISALPYFKDLTIVTFEKSEIFGLQFYMQGALRRSTIAAEAVDSKEPIHDVLEEIKQSPDTMEWAFFCMPKHMELLDEGLQKEGFKTERVDLKKWWLIRITGRPSAA